jgi:hypothetical protein
MACTPSIEFVLVIPGGPPTPLSLAELVKQQQQQPQHSQTPAPTSNEIPWVVVKKRRSSDECDALSERHSDGPHVRRVSAERRRSTIVKEVAKHLPMGAQCKRMLRIPAVVGLIVAMACVFGSSTPTLCRC